MHVALINPDIPQNTGNVARTCVMTGTSLHLVGELGFSLDDRHMRRAGLDYWQHLNFRYHESFDALVKEYGNHTFYFFSTRGKRRYSEIAYGYNDFLVFGSETEGLPPGLLDRWRDFSCRIPMVRGITRSLNLSNTVALVLYEALRQHHFPGME